MSLAIVEKNLLICQHDIVLRLLSIWLFIFRDVICLLDLVFTLIIDFTASQVCIKTCFVFTEKCFVVISFVNSSKSIYHTFVSFKFQVVKFFGMEIFDSNKFSVNSIFLLIDFKIPLASHGLLLLLISFGLSLVMGTCLSSISVILLEKF